MDATPVTEGVDVPPAEKVEVEAVPVQLAEVEAGRGGLGAGLERGVG